MNNIEGFTLNNEYGRVYPERSEGPLAQLAEQFPLKE